LPPAEKLTRDIVSSDRPKSSAARLGVAKAGRSMLRPYNGCPATSFFSETSVLGPLGSLCVKALSLSLVCEVSIEDPDLVGAANLLSPEDMNHEKHKTEC
jgi:hypothetical protein